MSCAAAGQPEREDLTDDPVGPESADDGPGAPAFLYLEKDIGRVPITDAKGQLVGIVDREDILKALIKS
jgi:CBS domain-containing protein